MKSGNVLIIENSGVDKSTLIHAVLGKEKAETGQGIKGTMDYLEIYESDENPFRIIDSVGGESSLIKKIQAVNVVKNGQWKVQKKAMKTVKLMRFAFAQMERQVNYKQRQQKRES